MLKKKKKNLETKHKKSSISEFIERSLPTDEEIEEFDEIIDAEAREDEIEDSLNEIYNEEEKEEDIGKLKIKRKRGFFFWLFSFVFLLCIGAFLYIGVYKYFFDKGSDLNMIELSIEGEEKIGLNQESFYIIKYRNPSNVPIRRIAIEAFYDDNFIFLESSPTPVQKESEEEVVKIKNSSWDIDILGPHSTGRIKIKGKVIDKVDKSSMINVKMSFVPDNFSSEFKKEASFRTFVVGTGLIIEADYSPTSFVGEEQDIVLDLNPGEENFLEGFSLRVEKAEEIEILDYKKEEESNLEIQKQDDVVYVSGLGEEAQKLIIDYKVKEKKENNEIIKLIFEKREENGDVYVFEELNIETEVIKSDLNLNIFANGSDTGGAIDFGEKLNYTISYSNKGEGSMQDVIIMAVLEGGFFDWVTLEDKYEGKERGNTITWTKEEIPGLAEVFSGDDGEINFSIDTLAFRESDIGKDFKLKSYAQFAVSTDDNNEDVEVEETLKNEDNKSNTVIHQINSDLNLKEEVRYFNADNIPVGSGPLPPKVGEVSSFKVYWMLTNNLHEIKEAKVSVILPEKVTWSDKSRTSVGSVTYDSNSNKVTWNIGRLPISVYRADAEFSIDFSPEDADRGRVMVLLPGAKVEAVDSKTKAKIKKKGQPKTTKLEDDDIASLSSNGIVE